MIRSLSHFLPLKICLSSSYNMNPSLCTHLAIVVSDTVSEGEWDRDRGLWDEGGRDCGGWDIGRRVMASWDEYKGRDGDFGDGGIHDVEVWDGEGGREDESQN